MKREIIITPRSSPRINYDEIAHLYDLQPYRDKRVDSNLLAFLNERPDISESPLSILDLGCGTGNQLVANRTHVTDARLVGLDLSYGMLRQAIPKADDIFWVQADGAMPPFADNSFDFISSQFSFHHVRDKCAMIESVLSILRPGGRFVMTNICPREMGGCLIYKYFPAALEIDLRDFLPRDTVAALMKQAGFVNVNATLNHITYEQDLRELFKTVKRRDTSSQLMAISDADYRAGLRRLEAELNQAGDRRIAVQESACLLTVCAGKYVAEVIEVDRSD